MRPAHTEGKRGLQVGERKRRPGGAADEKRMRNLAAGDVRKHIPFLCAGPRKESLQFADIWDHLGKFVDIYGIRRKNKGRIDMNPLFETEGSCLTITLPRELDHPASDTIRRESDRIMGRQYIGTIVFDFSETSFMDSSGIGLIMGRYRALGMRGNCVRAVNVNGHIEKLLRLSGLHRYMEIGKAPEDGSGPCPAP